MEGRHRDILHRYRSELDKDLEPEKLIGNLYSVLDAEDTRKVSEGSTRSERVERLLDLLARRGPDAFGAFLKALTKKNSHIWLLF